VLAVFEVKRALLAVGVEAAELLGMVELDNTVDGILALIVVEGRLMSVAAELDVRVKVLRVEDQLEATVEVDVVVVTPRVAVDAADVADVVLSALQRL
jgi:hypothetical protein